MLDSANKQKHAAPRLAKTIREDQLDIISLDTATPEMVLEALEGKPIYMDDTLTLFELKIKAITSEVQ